MIDKFVSEKLTRRDLFRVASRYGLTSTILGAAALAGPLTLSRVAEAANSTYEKRFKTAPKYTLKFGAPSGFLAKSSLVEKSGMPEARKHLKLSIPAI